MQPELHHSSAIRIFPGSAWVSVHLDCDADIALLVGLVSVALQAHTSAGPSGACVPCNVHRVVITANTNPAPEPGLASHPQHRPTTSSDRRRWFGGHGGFPGRRRTA
jgi:hypothetical protein